MVEGVEYFITRTDSRLESIEKKIDSLNEFKTRTIADSRLVAFVVSAFCGLVSMVASGVLVYLITTKMAAN